MEHLVKLEWLDLSFNNIVEIEGLETLVNLRDLSLAHNEIECARGLDSLANLEVLSLAANRISDLEDVKALRRFRKLRCLNLKNNPVCDADDFRKTVLAFIKGLKFLDYVRIEEEDIQKAREDKQTELLELEDQEKHAESLASEKDEQIRVNKELEAANLKGINTLFDDMMKEDSELSKLRKLSGFDEIERDYRMKIEEQTESFLSTILDRHREKLDEVRFYNEALGKLKVENEEQCKQCIADFQHFYKRAVRSLEEAKKKGNGGKEIVADIQEKLQTMSDEIMDMEMLMVDRVNHALAEFENRITKMKNENMDSLNSYFRSVEEYENYYQTSLNEMVQLLLERAAQGEIPETDPELAALLIDKDALQTAIVGSHDNHLGHILKLEERVTERESDTDDQIVARAREDEYRRNRFRVAEAADLVDKWTLQEAN
eukprot:946576_1